MNIRLGDMSEAELIDAIEQSMFDAWLVFARLPNASLHDNHVLWYATGLTDALLNAVLSARLAARQVDAEIQDRKSYFEARDLPFSWYTGPSTSPDNLGRQLKRHGLLLEDESIGMAADITGVSGVVLEPSNLKIARVDDKGMLATWIDVIRNAYPFSGTFARALSQVMSVPYQNEQEADHLYLGYLHGTPVATTTLSLNGKIASIYDVSTLPSARRQGIGTAMTRFALMDAREMGYQIAVLQSSKMGRTVYERLGFKEYCGFCRYVYDPLT